MKLVVLLVVIMLAVVVIGVVMKASKRGVSTPKLPYVRKEFLLTAAERSFFHVLNRHVGEQYTISCQVRVADVLAIEKGLPGKERQSYLNRITSKHVDFVLCNPTTMKIIAAIELDDKSHDKPARKERDAFLNEAFKAAGTPLIRFKAKSSYSGHELLETIQAAIPSVHAQEKLSNTQAAQPNQSQTNCPNCSAPMVRKKSTRGNYAGSYYLACSAYPKCKTTMPA